MSTRLLFLCSQRDGRSRMARACVEQRNETGLEVRSAWLEPCKLDPLAGAVMEEMGIVLDDDAQPTLAEIMQLEFDVVVTLCPEAAEACPLLPGRPIVIDWNLLGTGTLPADPSGLWRDRLARRFSAGRSVAARAGPRRLGRRRGSGRRDAEAPRSRPDSPAGQPSRRAHAAL